MSNQTPRHPEITVKLAGKDGNAFSVVGRCLTACKKAGLSDEEIARFRNEAFAGDYDHLLRTCINWFDVA
jgi:hypothetical protein